MDFTHTDSARQPDQRNPTPFTIPSVIDVEPGEVVISDPVVLTWPGQTSYSTPSRIRIGISGSGAEYRIDGGAWTTATNWISSGQQVEVRMTASSLRGVSRSANLNFGTYSETFTVSTADNDTAVLIDQSRVSSGYQVSNNGTTVTNVSGGSDFRRYVPTDIVLPTNRNQFYYWEIELGDGGPTGNWNGYVGLVSDFRLDSAEDGAWFNGNPVHGNSLGFRGNGQIWTQATQQTCCNSRAYRRNDTLQIVFNPSTGNSWFGVNGFFYDFQGNFTTPVSGNMTVNHSVLSGTNHFIPILQGRDQGQSLTLRSRLSEFTYPLPAGTTPLSNAR